MTGSKPALADTLFDYGRPTPDGWQLAPCYLPDPFGSGEVSGLEPSPTIRNRATPGAFRVAKFGDKTGFFWVGKDVWQPGHDVGLRLTWRSPGLQRVKVCSWVAPINPWVGGAATTAVFHNRSELSQGSAKARCTSALQQIIQVHEGDEVDVLMGYRDTIDNLECLFRAVILPAGDVAGADPATFETRNMARLDTYMFEIGQIIEKELREAGRELGAAGLFSVS